MPALTSQLRHTRKIWDSIVITAGVRILFRWPEQVRSKDATAGLFLPNDQKPDKKNAEIAELECKN